MVAEAVAFALFAVLLILGAVVLGRYLAAILEGRVRWLAWLETPLYRLAGTSPTDAMDWRRYALALLIFNGLGVVVLFALLRLQGVLPLNPNGLPAVEPALAFNIAVSFVVNANWQAYAGETTLSHLSQMVGLTGQNFFSAATGVAALAALIRGLRGKQTQDLGNFWVDLTRTTLYVLLPLSLVFAVFLVSQGVVQTHLGSVTVERMSPGLDAAGFPTREQTIALGPVASQIAIKQLGTNGGGYFNANAAHPLENPTPLTNLLHTVAILLIPAALCFAFGQMVGDRRQGWAVFSAMFVLFTACFAGTFFAERAGNPAFEDLDLTTSANWEGKESRFGIGASALWATATTAASNGSVNAMHDSFTPLGGLFPMLLMQLGEVVFGGVGVGLNGMLMFVVVTVFVSGLMVGRTPEYLGKKIEAFEMKMAALVILVPSILILGGAALAILLRQVEGSVSNPGAHGFSQLLYNLSSMANNNGSAFAGFNANTPFYNWFGAVLLFAGRFWLIVPVLALAGSLGRKKHVPVGPGTLSTHTPLFVALLCGIVLIVGALTYIPALVLGPVVEHLQLAAGGVR